MRVNYDVDRAVDMLKACHPARPPAAAAAAACSHVNEHEHARTRSIRRVQAHHAKSCWLTPQLEACWHLMISEGVCACVCVRARARA